MSKGPIRAGVGYDKQQDCYQVFIKRDEGPWHHATTFPTKDEAVKFIRDNIGHCDENGNISKG